jgi:MFS family permease
MTDLPRPKKNRLSKIPIWPMWLLGLVTLVDSADGAIVRGITTPLEHAFHIQDFQISLLASAPIAINALVTMPAGYLADRWRRVNAIGHTLVAWSIVCAGGAVAPDYGFLLATRGLTGFGQGINEPSANSVLADFYPLSGRGRAFSVQQCLNYTGVGLGAALAGFIGEQLGWRASYLFVTLPGFVVAILVYKLKEPKRGSSDAHEMGKELYENEHRNKFFENGFWDFFKKMIIGLGKDVKVILQIPTLRLTLVGVASILFTVNAIGFWLPTFYQRAFHVSETTATTLFAIMLIGGGIPGTIFGGRIADKYVKKITGARVVIPAVAAALTTTLFLISFLRLPILLTVLLELIGFFTGTTAVPALRAGLSDVTPGTLRGTGFGAFNLTSVLFGSAAAPTIVGAISQSFHQNLRIAFIIVLPPVYIGCWFLYRARKHIEKDTQRIFEMVIAAVNEQNMEYRPPNS